MTLVLLHALPLDGRMWERHEGVALRLYDLGSSMDEWAEAVLGAVEGRLVLVGASMGGYCALAVARRAPERVAGLLLAGSRADADSEERRAGRAETVRLIREGGAEALWESMRDRLFAPESDPDPAVVERARALAVDQDPEGLVRAVEAIRDRRDERETLTGLGDRALIVIGDHDPFVTPSDVAGDVRVLDRCGHLPSMQRPDEFDAILEEALGRWT